MLELELYPDADAFLKRLYEYQRDFYSVINRNDDQQLVANNALSRLRFLCSSEDKYRLRDEYCVRAY